MKNLQINWKGTTPLIMHSCKCVNPLHTISKELSKYTSKRGKSKTEEDFVIISKLEWLGGAYLVNDEFTDINDYFEKDNDLYIPAQNIEATIINAAKTFKLGTAVEKYCKVIDDKNSFNYGEKKPIKELIEDKRYQDVRPMGVMGKKVIRTRPRFDRWETTFVYQYDEDKINLDSIVNAIEYAGQYVGLCDSRPKYGKFVAIIQELD